MKHAVTIYESVPSNFAGTREAAFQVLATFTSETRSAILLTFLAFLLFVIIEVKQSQGDYLKQINSKPAWYRFAVYATLVSAILMLGTAYTGLQQAFIYFQF